MIDVGGVGYLVSCSGRTLSRLSAGQTVSLLVETQVREDAIQLYGFLLADEKLWFRLLTTVQGVGAKGALAVLSVARAGRACPRHCHGRPDRAHPRLGRRSQARGPGDRRTEG